MSNRFLTILVFVTLLTIVSCQGYYHERNTLQTKFESFHEIENVSVTGFDHEGYFILETVSFSIASRPDTTVTLWANTYKLKSLSIDTRFDVLSIIQIGQYQFRQKGTLTRLNQDGTSTSDRFTSNAIALGIKGDYRDLITVRIESIQDLINNYDLLLAELANWPTESNPGSMISEDAKYRTATTYYTITSD